MRCVINSIVMEHTSSADLMDFLSVGHGYVWIAFHRTPTLIAVGVSQRYSLPQMTIIANIVTVWTGDEDFIRRLNHSIKILARGGRTHG